MRRIAPEQAAVTPLQRTRMRAAALAIKDGTKHIPLRCVHCNSSSVLPDPTMQIEYGEQVLDCAACGRFTRLSTASKQRQREITAYIREGIDLPKGKHT
jgi:hypothetical protein